MTARPEDADQRDWERFRAIASDATDIVFESSLDGVLEWTSPNIVEVLGWEPYELVGARTLDLVHPDDLERVTELREALLDRGDSVSGVLLRLRRADGRFQAMSVRSRARVGDDGGVRGAITVAQDVQDRLATIRALATLSEGNAALLRAEDEQGLLQSMCDTVVGTGRYALAWYGRVLHDEDRTVAVQAAAGAGLAYLDSIRISWGDGPTGQGPTGRCIRSRTAQITVDFATAPGFGPWRAAAAAQGLACSIALPVVVDGEVDGAFMVYATEPGSFDDLAAHLMQDLASQLGFGISRLRGAAQLESARRAATTQASRLQATWASMLDPVVLLAPVDPDAEALDLAVVDANRAFCSYLGVSRDDAVGRSIRSDLTTPLLELVHDRLVECYRSRETLVVDGLQTTGPGGEPTAYDLRAIVVDDLIALTCRDVTEKVRSAQQVADSERRYRLLVENASDVVLVCDSRLAVSWVSDSMRRTFGWSPEEIVGRSSLDFVHPDDRQRLADDVLPAVQHNQPVRLRYRWAHRDGGHRWVESIGRPLPDLGDGEALRVVALRDIEDQARAEHELAVREERYRLLAENASDVVWQVDEDGRFLWVSESVERVLGWSPAQLLGRPKVDLIHPEDRPRVISLRRDVMTGLTVDGDARIACADGSWRWMGMTVHQFQMGATVSRVSSLRDIQHEMEVRSELDRVSGLDPLTGLANRTSMIARIQNLLDQAHSVQRHVGVLCIGVDRITDVNDALTHTAGDRLLTTVASRIASALDQPDTLSRGSGDEFLVVLPGLGNATDALPTAELIRDAVHGTVEIGDHLLDPTVSIGIATGTRGSDAHQLVRAAGLAMRQAKIHGRDRAEFADSRLAAEAERRLGLEDRIRAALAEGEIETWYMPVVDLASGDLTGYEALVRWRRADGVVVPPDEFLPTAERSTLAADIDRHVLAQALETLAGLPPTLTMAVNVSAPTLSRPGYAAHVAALLDRFGVAPARLHLEVTETSLLDFTPSLESTVQSISALGARWYVDDFGTGYSSISHLRDLPISGLKLDRSFTDGLGHVPRAGQLAQALLGLAEGLDLDTVAEGVETAEQAARLREMGWRHGQGWLYGRPRPMEGTLVRPDASGVADGGEARPGPAS